MWKLEEHSDFRFDIIDGVSLEKMSSSSCDGVSWELDTGGKNLSCLKGLVCCCEVREVLLVVGEEYCGTRATSLYSVLEMLVL